MPIAPLPKPTQITPPKPGIAPLPKPISEEGTGERHPEEDKPTGKDINLKDVKVDTQVLPKATPQQSSSAVKTLQSAIINFAKDFASHSIHTPALPNMGERKDEKGQVLYGADPFSNFLVNNYVNKANPVGKQLVNVDEKMPIRMDTSKENDNLKGILSSMQRIGSGMPGQETTPDGLWGDRTTKALNNIYALGYAMLNLKKDMGADFKATEIGADYSDKDLAEFKANLDAAKSADKAQIAPALAQNINKLRTFYANFRDDVLEPHQEFIKQEKPLLVEPGKRDESLNVSKDAFEKYRHHQVNTYIASKPVAISPNDLENIERFKMFILRYPQVFNLSKEDLNDQKTINSLLMLVKKGFEQPEAKVQETR